MATILAHITVKPGTAERFEQIAHELFAGTHANETRMNRYEYWRGADVNTYYTLLSFDSFVGFLEHQTSEHHESASPALGEVIAGMRLEWVDPIQGASPLSPTSQEAIGDDASDLMKLYSKRYAVSVADWWLPLR